MLAVTTISLLYGFGLVSLSFFTEEKRECVDEEPS